MAAAVFDERDMRKNMTVTVTIKSRPTSRILMAVGLWVMKLGLLIGGVGHVEIEDLSLESND